MSWPFEAWIGWRYFRKAKRPGSGPLSFFSFVTTLGIALGIAVLITAMSIFNGFQKEVAARMLEVVPQVEVLTPAIGTDPQAFGQAVRRAAPEGVVAIAPVLVGDALAIRGETMRGARVRGIDPEAEAKVTALGGNIAREAFATLKQKGPHVVLGAALAEQLQVRVGDTVVLTPVRGPVEPTQKTELRPYTVTGIFSSRHFLYDSSYAFCSMETAQQLFGAAGVLGIEVKLADVDQAQVVARQLAVAESLLQWPVQVRDWTQANREWFDGLQIQKRLIAIIVSLIVAVAAFNLVSTLVMSVEDKRSDIAILRTLGASPRSIMLVFMVNGASAGILGTSAGLALGLLVTRHITEIVAGIEALLHTTLLRSDVYLIDHMPSDPHAGEIFAVMLMSITLSLTATLYPSWRASRLRPVDGLRHE